MAGKRKSGVIMHISSLPGEFGSGDFGSCARRFAGMLADAGFSIWQILPLTPVDPALGNSPYSSSSAFAGNRMFISPELLCEEGLIKPEDADRFKTASGRHSDHEHASFCRKQLLDAAFKNFIQENENFKPLRSGFARFCAQETFWLDDYALFRVIKENNGGRSWTDWPHGLAFREKAAVAAFSLEHAHEILFVKFEQFIFFRQLEALSSFCAGLGVTIFGDVPIYTAHDSADVWSHRELFCLEADGSQRGQAGVPPDYFSRTGQLWGNPLYDWGKMKRDGFVWWRRRLAHMLRYCGMIRIDHFRGLCAYWDIPAGEKTAEKGRWRHAAGREMLAAFSSDIKGAPLPLVAEDLGIITDDVRQLMQEFALPGMSVLLFAFGGGADNPYLPHNVGRRSVIYTGTHDNDTVRGWWETGASDAEKESFADYAGTEITSENAARVMIRLALSSAADTAVIPMQDILGLGSECRMNTPSRPLGNWAWRMLPSELAGFSAEPCAFYKKMNGIYGR